MERDLTFEGGQVDGLYDHWWSSRMVVGGMCTSEAHHGLVQTWDTQLTPHPKQNPAAAASQYWVRWSFSTPQWQWVLCHYMTIRKRCVGCLVLQLLLWQWLQRWRFADIITNFCEELICDSLSCSLLCQFTGSLLHWGTSEHVSLRKVIHRQY